MNCWGPATSDNSVHSIPNPSRYRGTLAGLGLVCLFGCCLSSHADEPLPPRFGVGTTVQLPTFGVAIDAAGILAVRSHPAPDVRFHLERMRAAAVRLDAKVMASSRLRKISLVRLDEELRRTIAAGDPLDDELRHLAGLHGIRYLVYLPDSRDIVLAGPAEGWVADRAGRSVGISTGRPIVLLEDLAAALRAYPRAGPTTPFVGCSINPSSDGLAKLVRFQRQIPSAVSRAERGIVAAQLANGMRESLGMAAIEVFGVSNRTHFAQVLIEADYRMKRIGTGLEPAPIRMPTFLSSLRGARHETLQRWWFVPEDESVRFSSERGVIELRGQGVRLLGEDQMISEAGDLAARAGRLSRASQQFTTAFTKRYPEIAAASPVYAQLRNMIDLSLVAAFAQRESLYERAGASLPSLTNESVYAIETHSVARLAPCAINSVWKSSRLFTVAGGGVSIQPPRMLTEGGRWSHADETLDDLLTEISEDRPVARWWWD